MCSRLRKGMVAGSAVSVAWLFAAAAFGQAAVEPRPDGEVEAASEQVVPPRLLEDPGVAYPSRARDEHFYERVEVDLIVELDDSGKVVRAKVETPDATAERLGFNQAALESAQRLRFEPGQRDRVPVAARIRYRYAFELPAPTLFGRVVDARTGSPIAGARTSVRDAGGIDHSSITASDGSWTLPDVARGSARVIVDSAGHVAGETEISLAPGEQTRVLVVLQPRVDPASDTHAPAIEVTVRGERLAPTVSSYTRAEVRQIPGAFGDPFRAIETLPGITPLVSGLPFFYVRGAPPGNVGYFLDGVRVPYLYHVGAGPSVIQPALIERVDLYPGGYPARFGRFAGGVVAASTTDPSAELRGEANLRLLDVGGMIETGFAAGRGSVMLGGRYSYTAALVSLVAPEVHLDYRDFQGRISYDLGPNDRLSLFSFGSYDLFGEYANDVLDITFGSEFYRADVRHDHRFDGGRIRTAVTFGYDRTNAGLISGDGDLRNVADRSIRARSEFFDQLGSRVLLRAGADVGADAYRLEGPNFSDLDSPQTRQIDQQFPSRTDYAAGAWLDLVLQLGPAVEITPGLRADLYRSGRSSAFGLDPRIAARLEVTPGLRIVSAVGLVHQPPSFLLPLPGVTPSLKKGLQRSFQTSAGVEGDLDRATIAGVTVFYNAFFNMTDSIGTMSAEGSFDMTDSIATMSGEGNLDYGLRTRGSSFGAELFLRRRLTKRLGGFVSYTLSRSVRNRSGEFLSAFDRPHVGNAALSYDLGAGWRSGARFLFYSGTPIQDGVGSTLVPSSVEVKRERAFYRLDLRIEKRWVLGDAAWIALVLEFMNATLNTEIWPGGEEVGPVSIPSLGVEAGF